MSPQTVKAFAKECADVEGYLVLSKGGKLVAHDLTALEGPFKTPEVSSWVLNIFDNITENYPESHYCHLKFKDYGLLLEESTDNITGFITHRNAEIPRIRSQMAKHKKSNNPPTKSGDSDKPFKKGQTVFLNITDDHQKKATVIGKETVVTRKPHKSEDKKKSPLKSPYLYFLLIGVIALFALYFGFANQAAEQRAEQINEVETTPAEVATPELVPIVVHIKEPIVEEAVASEPELEPENNVVSVDEVVEPLTPPAPPQIDFESLARKADSQCEILQKLASRVRAEAIATERHALALNSAKQAQEAFENANFSAAKSLWSTAADQFGVAASQTAEKAFKEAYNQIGLESPQQYAKVSWTQISTYLQRAQKAFSTKAYENCVQNYTSATQLIPEFKTKLQHGLESLLADAAKSNSRQTGVLFSQKLLKLAPNHNGALSYLYRNYYTPGQIVAGPHGLQLAYVPPGTFRMGSPEDEANRDTDEILRTVSISKGFFMSETEITQEQWSAVMEVPFTTDEVDEERFLNPKFPAHGITLQQADAFCKKLSRSEGVTYRLPTEAEWEYACRAGTQTPFNNGKSTLTYKDAHVFDPEQALIEAPREVGSLEVANTWGLYDMHGNVWEWCSDWSGPYPKQNSIDPKGPKLRPERVDLAMKILRGGSYYDEADKARSANRWEYSPGVSAPYIGFRIVREVTVFP